MAQRTRKRITRCRIVGITSVHIKVTHQAADGG